MKIFIAVDMEGITGVVHWPQPTTGGRELGDDENQRQQMTADVNAVIKGARSAGASEFVILDSHGSAPPRPNLRLKDIDPEAKLLSYRNYFGSTQDLLEDGYDAIFIVGMHAVDGVADGILSHNFTSTFKEIYFNGLRIGEIGFFALWAGIHNIPLAFLSGDDAACQEAKELIPDIVTTSTKKGITHGFALLYPEAQVRADLERGAAEAISNTGDINPLAMSGPVEVKIKMGGGRETIKADVCAMFPWVERLSGTSIGFSVDTVYEALSSMRALHMLAESQR
jgi:D-amino peptidase